MWRGEEHGQVREHARRPRVVVVRPALRESIRSSSVVHRPPSPRRRSLSGGQGFTVQLAATAQAPAQARRAMAEHVGPALGADGIREAQLLVTELVTNAVRHGGLGPEDAIVLEVRLRDGTLRVEVADGGPGFDPATALEPHREDPGGWGLLLVSRLASRWGVTRGRPNVAWFEMDLPVRG